MCSCVHFWLVLPLALNAAPVWAEAGAPGNLVTPPPLPPEAAVRFSPRRESSISLEGRLAIPPRADALEPQATGAPGVVLCHPDLRYGGSMSAVVVVALQKAFAGAGFATLRFNLRGVGASEGAFDNGRGEVQDCLGALDFLRAQAGVDAARVALVGYSFGSWVGLQACAQDGKVRACACLGFPIPATEDPEQHPYFGQIHFPTLFLTGTRDSISSLEAVRRIVDAHSAQRFCELRELPDADHFFAWPQHLTDAVQTIVGFISEALKTPPAESTEQEPSASPAW